MIHKDMFANIREELAKQDAEREILIQLSRKIIKESKVIIYALQRDERPSLDKIKSLVLQITDPSKGIAHTALQEYVEALTFYSFVTEKKLLTKEELGVEADVYLLGLCDLTGELVRKAVKAAIEKKKEEVFSIRDFVDELYGEFLQFHLRNGELRKKSDSIKWNLQKLEELCLRLS